MEKRKKAIFTFICNGHKFFGLWYNYYKKFFEPQDIWVLDMGSTDGALDGYDCQIVKRPETPRIDYGNIVVNEFKTELFKKYKWVMYTDYDEIVWHPIGIDNLIDCMGDRPYITASGYEMLQVRKEEPEPYDFSKSMLSQRKYWFRNANYDKTPITQVDFKWDSGFHTVENKPRLYNDYKLTLLHFSKIDFEYMNALHKRLAAAGSCLAGGHFPVDKELEKIWFWFEREAKLIPMDLRQQNFV